MIKVDVDSNGETISKVRISHRTGSIKDLAFELSVVIDRIMADEYVKLSPALMNEEITLKEQVVKIKRQELCELMKEEPFIQPDYFCSKETSDALYQEYPWLNED